MEPKPHSVALDTSALKARARELGFDACGVCAATPPPHLEAYASWLAKRYHGTMRYLERHLPLKASPESLLPGARSVVAVALDYNRPNPYAEGRPHLARYALGRDYHKVLRRKLRVLASWMGRRYGPAPYRICVDSAPILERDFANLAGLGWFGKNTMLIDSKRGSWFVIGLMLTALEFEPDAPSLGSCGTCRRCVDACPTGAIVYENDRWQLDARRCVSYLTIEHKGPIPPELHGGVGRWTFGCDVCQEVCPFNAERHTQPLRAKRSREPDFLLDRPWPSLEELARIAYPEWDILTRGSAVRRAGWEGLRRNAHINLLNQRPDLQAERRTHREKRLGSSTTVTLSENGHEPVEDA